jgi:hypothetical protein
MRCWALFLLGTVSLGVSEDIGITRAKLNRPSALECIVRAEKTCALGNAPQVSVRIVNRTSEDVLMVGSLDGSDIQRRYPYCYFQVIGPDGKNTIHARSSSCGYLNPLRVKDFVKVPKGGQFDPYQGIDNYGFFSAHEIEPSTFDRPGDYRIRFIYCTAEKDLRKWHGKAGGELEALFAKVPKVVLTSNEIVVRVVKKDNGKE